MPTQAGQSEFETIMRRNPIQTLPLRCFTLALLLMVGFAQACIPQTAMVLPTETPTQSKATFEVHNTMPTPRPTATPTQAPLGTPLNPIMVGFILTPEMQQAIEAAEDLVFLISKNSGLALESQIFPDFQSLSTAISNGDLHLFWLNPLEYIYLNWEGAADVVLLTNHLGVYTYGVSFMANVFRGFTSYYDPQTGTSYGNPTDALQQFSGTRPCFLNPDSIPGYYLPLGLLADTSTPTLDPVFTYSYTATIRALYIQGICDFGVTYALIGDPRTAADITQTIPDAQNQVMIVWQSDGIIPNINLSASPALPLHLQHRLQEAFLALPKSPEGLALLSTALNYDVEALKTVNDTLYNPMRAALIPLALDLASITQQ